MSVVEGGRSRGQEDYVRWEKRGWEVGYPGERELGEIEIYFLQHCTNILQ